jgi:hypothetical protein
MGYFFHFSILYCIHRHIHWILYILAYLNSYFKSVLALPKTAHSAQTHKSIISIWIVWSTLYLYLCFLVQSRPNPILSILPNGKCFHQWFNKISNLDLLLPQFQLFTLVIFPFRFYYSCNKITKTWVQISRQNWNGFF